MVKKPLYVDYQTGHLLSVFYKHQVKPRNKVDETTNLSIHQANIFQFQPNRNVLILVLYKKYHQPQLSSMTITFKEIALKTKMTS